MATGVINAGVYIADLDATGFVYEVSSPFTIDTQDATTLADGNFTVVKPGLRHGEMTISAYQDFAASGFYEKINQSDLGGSNLVSIVPNGSSATAGDPGMFVRGPIDQLVQQDAAVGEMLKASIHVLEDVACGFGPVLHPSALRSSTANGTAVAQAGPTAVQALYSALHVTSGSGGNLTVTVQSDDSGSFLSATTRITHTVATGATSELKSVAGNFSTETHLRSSWTISAGSFTFVHVVAVLNLT